MRALVVLLVALVFLIPSVLLLQQPRGRWSLLLDATGLTLGAIAVALVLIGLGLAVWRLIKGR